MKVPVLLAGIVLGTGLYLLMSHGAQQSAKPTEPTPPAPVTAAELIRRQEDAASRVAAAHEKAYQEQLGTALYRLGTDECILARRCHVLVRYSGIDLMISDLRSRGFMCTNSQLQVRVDYILECVW